MFKFLPFLKGTSFSSMFTLIPIVSFTAAMAYQVPTVTPPSAIANQAWLVSVVVAAMGIVKIVMWIKDIKSGGEDKEVSDESKIIEMMNANKVLIDKLLNNDEKIVEIQNRLTEAQMKSLEAFSKILETMAVFKIMLENHEDNVKGMVEQIASRSVGEIKDYLRPK